jgi:4-alpha-glucanotransferase
MEEGLLPRSGLKDVPSFPDGRVEYRVVTKYKETLFHIAYRHFKEQRKGDWEFEHFCQENEEWLEDFVLFIALKDHFGSRIWNEWPAGTRDRRAKKIKGLKEEFRDRMEMEKFLQYLFFKQWLSLKTYCNRRGIQIIGDVPIYVNPSTPQHK